MLLSYSCFDKPGLDIHLGALFVAHPRFRIVVDTYRNATFDLGLLPTLRHRTGKTEPAPPRNTLQVVLGGQSLVRTPQGEHLMRPGEYLSTAAPHTWVPRYQNARVLLVEWDAGSLGTRTLPSEGGGTLSPTSLHRLLQEIEGLGACYRENRAPNESAVAILDLLRAEGLPLDPIEAGALHDEANDWTRALGRAIDRALCRVDTSPSVGDLQSWLGWSPRTIQARMNEFHLRYGYRSTGWRDRIRRIRLTWGLSLLGSPELQPGHVASLLGYSSHHALYNAFREAGLPSPSRVKRLVSQKL